MYARVIPLQLRAGFLADFLSVRRVHEDFEAPSNAGIPSAVGLTTASQPLCKNGFFAQP